MGNAKSTCLWFHRRSKNNCQDRKNATKWEKSSIKEKLRRKSNQQLRLENDRRQRITLLTGLRKKRDKARVMRVIKPHTYDQFCDVLRTKPFIQHPDIFEEAVHVDLAFNIPTDAEMLPDNESFTLRLMDNGYQISETELDDLESRLLLRKKFRVLKQCILDFYSIDMKSLQELCRASLKRAHLDSKSHYRHFVTNLNYPERLKTYLLREECVFMKHEKIQGVYYKSFVTY